MFKRVSLDVVYLARGGRVGRGERSGKDHFTVYL